MTSLFRPLRNLLAPKPSEPTSTLSDAQLLALGRLRSSDEWEVFVRMLDDHVTLQGDILLAPQIDANLLHFTRGRIAGLREAPLLVDQILTRAQYANDQADRKRSTADRPTAARRRALYGTPGWSESARK